MKNTWILIFLLLYQFSFSQENIQKEWDKTQRAHTGEAYSSFIKKYQGHALAEQAKIKRTELDSIQVLISTYLGNETRNYYGNKAPEKLNLIWKHYLGEGLSPAYGQQKIWKGAGWTGQPLYVREKGHDYLIIGAFDYNLKKIDVATGKLVWQYTFDDILKGTGSIWVNKNAENLDDRYVILQGSRLGVGNDKKTALVPSLRAVSYITGKELWRMNSKATESYSRDVDGSALIYNDTAYLALENALFTVFDPDYKNAEMRDSMLQPKIYNELVYYNSKDMEAHGDDLVPEASPTLFNRHVYTPSGTGWVYGYNIDTQKNDWEYYIGMDMNGSAPLTYDSNLLIAVEKQYLEGHGGVLKLNPSLSPDQAAQWYFPVPDKHWFHWEGGLVGSVTTNDAYVKENDRHLAVFSDITGYLYVVEHDKIDLNVQVKGPDGQTKYATPVLLAKEKIEGAISTPIIVEDKIIAATDNGLFLFQIEDDGINFSLKKLDYIPHLELDATPVVYDGKVFVACRDGFLYCFGDKK